jgi:hypothetical protein
MRKAVFTIQAGALAGATLLACAAPAFAGDLFGVFGDSPYRGGSPVVPAYGYGAEASGAYVERGNPFTISHSVQPYAYSHTKTVAVPTTVYQPVTRSYTVPVRGWRNVETVESVPVTAYRTVREVHQVPVVTYQNVETERTVPVRAWQQVRAVQQVPVTTYATVNRTEYQPSTYYQTYQKSWCCSYAR